MEFPVFQTFKGTHRLADILVSSSMAPSKKEAHRLLTQGAVEVDGKKACEKDSVDLASACLDPGRQAAVCPRRAHVNLKDVAILLFVHLLFLYVRLPRRSCFPRPRFFPDKPFASRSMASIQPPSSKSSFWGNSIPLSRSARMRNALSSASLWVPRRVPILAFRKSPSSAPLVELPLTVMIEISTRIYTIENVNFTPEKTELMKSEHHESVLIHKADEYLSRDQQWEGLFMYPVEGRSSENSA